MTNGIRIETHEKDKYFFLLFVDGSFYRTLSYSIFGKNFYFKNSFFNKDEFIKEFDEFELKKAKEFVLKKLDKRMYHSKEIESLLEKNLVPKNVQKKILFFFQEKSWIDDQVFLELFFKEKKRKKKSPREILLLLQKRGINSSNLNFYTKEETKEILYDLVNKKKKKISTEDPRNRQKIIAFLQRKGFHFDDIREALENYSLDFV